MCRKLVVAVNQLVIYRQTGGPEKAAALLRPDPASRGKRFFVQDHDNRNPDL
jgi:hypothetical protein